ncbi:MAG: hypothetical protein VYA71_05860, partial [Pseudomonadota bacterium]|nr:hypothetical protein [Pseudomonadota bacterium]
MTNVLTLIANPLARNLDDNKIAGAREALAAAGATVAVDIPDYGVEVAAHRRISQMAPTPIQAAASPTERSNDDGREITCSIIRFMASG